MTTARLTAIDRRRGQPSEVGDTARVAPLGKTERQARPTFAMPESEIRRTVLVIGSCTGDWIWKKVVLLLRELGHEVHVASTTTNGDGLQHGNLAADLATEITGVVNLLEVEKLTAATLVGWNSDLRLIAGVLERVPERLQRVLILDDRSSRLDRIDVDAHFARGNRIENRTTYEHRRSSLEVVRTSVEEFVRELTHDPVDEEWLFAKSLSQELAVSVHPLELFVPPLIRPLHSELPGIEGNGSAA